MRRVLFVVLITVLTCSLAAAQSVKLPAKPQIKGAEELKVLMQDSIVDTHFAETDGKYYIRVSTRTHKGYAPDLLRLTAEQAATVDGPWEVLSGLPYDFTLEKAGPHSFNLRIDEQPSLPNLRVSLSIVKGGVEQPVHAVKLFKLGCTCVKVLPE